jgi:hypothetical protein
MVGSSFPDLALLPMLDPELRRNTERQGHRSGASEGSDSVAFIKGWDQSVVIQETPPVVLWN